MKARHCRHNYFAQHALEKETRWVGCYSNLENENTLTIKMRTHLEEAATERCPSNNHLKMSVTEFANYFK